MIYLQRQSWNRSERGDAVIAAKLHGRRVSISRHIHSLPFHKKPGSRSNKSGFTLIELVITITVLTILTMGVVPLLKLSVKRQKEQQLHDSLRQIRMAIDEFHRDTVGMNCSATTVTGTGGAPLPTAPPDPRSKVVISDCTIFGVDNPDRYPPDLQTLLDGVNVVPRGGAGAAGGRGLESTGTSTTDTASVLDNQLSTRKKVYLRSIPIDPMTGRADWCVRSCYDPPDSGCSEGAENVYDVHSKSDEKALNGDKYSDW
ncbi:MAG TPA: type II secretion system protein [Pyrinomonadaceae bacterium]